MASSTPSSQRLTFPFARTVNGLQQDDAQTLPLPSNTTELCLYTFGVTPKREQLMVVRFIGERKDCLLIAGCGWSKTLTYFLPLILWPDRVIVIISPLKALMEEQHQRLKDKGISSITIHGDKRLPLDIENRMAGGEFRAVFSTAEKVVVDGELFTSLFRRSSWRSRLLAVDIDEAHCVSTWGKSFRTAYNSIGDLRAKLPHCVPFVAMSATLCGDIMRDIKEKLHFRDDTVVVKVNIDRRNVKYVVQSFRSKADAFKSLEFLLDFEKAIVYFDNKFDLLAARNHLRRMASGKETFIRGYYSDFVEQSGKTFLMNELKKGNISILLCTEAAGIGCDILDVVRVVQFNCPENLSVLVQKLVRAGRDPKMQPYGILYTFKEAEAHPHIGLRNFVTTRGCRRAILNTAFHNEHTILDDCCDFCDNKKGIKLSIPSRLDQLRATVVAAFENPAIPDASVIAALSAIPSVSGLPLNFDLLPFSSTSATLALTIASSIPAISVTFATSTVPAVSATSALPVCPATSTISSRFATSALVAPVVTAAPTASLDRASSIFTDMIPKRLSSTERAQHVRVRQPDEKCKDKDAILAWRQKEAASAYERSEIYTKRAIMSDATVDRLVEKVGSIKKPDDIDSAISWSEVLPGLKRRLADVVMKLNSDIENSTSHFPQQPVDNTFSCSSLQKTTTKRPYIRETSTKKDATSKRLKPLHLTSPSTLATTNASTVGPWRRGQPLPKAKSEQSTKSDTTGKKDVSKDKSATLSSQAPASNEPQDHHSNKVMHRIDEGYESRENSVPAMEANMRRTGGYVEPTIHATAPSIEGGEKTGESNNAPTAPNSDKGSQEERTRNAKASRADRSNGDSPSWRRKDNEIASTKEDLVTSSQAAKPTPETVKASTVKNGDGRPGRMSRSAATLYRKGNYLAKANGSKGAARISDVPKIHTSLSLQTAGDQNLEPAKKFGIEVQAKQYSEGWDSDASQVETKSAYVAEDWDSDVTQVEEMDVKNDAPVRNQGMDATREVQLLAQVELLRNEVARHQEEVVSSHGRLVQVHAISQINEDRLAEMTATFEEFKKTHHQKIDESAQTITTLETKLVSAEEHAQISASKMVVMQNQVDQERAARRKDKEEIEIKSQALEDIRTEMSAVEDRHSNELRYQGDLAKEAHEKYERELMVHAKDLDALSKLKENHIKQTTELERYKSQAESAASNLKSAEIAWESQKSILKRNFSEAEKRCMGFKVQNDNLQRRLKDFSTQALSIQQRASAQVSSAESGEGISSVEGEGVGKKSTQCQVVELCGVNGYVRHGEEVPRAEDITAKHCCIDPAEFQELKDANDQFKIETAEGATTMTALKTAHESLRDRLEELETKFNKMNALDVSVGRVSAQHSQSRWAAFPGSNPYRQGGGHPVMMTAPGVSGTGYPTQPCPVMMPPYYPQGCPPMFAFPGGAMAPYGFMPISPVDAYGSLEPASQALTAVASGTMDLTHQYPHQYPHQHSQHLVGPPPRLPQSAVAIPAVNALQF